MPKQQTRFLCLCGWMIGLQRALPKQLSFWCSLASSSQALRLVPLRPDDEVLQVTWLHHGHDSNSEPFRGRAWYVLSLGPSSLGLGPRQRCPMSWTRGLLRGLSRQTLSWTLSSRLCRALLKKLGLHALPLCLGCLLFSTPDSGCVSLWDCLPDHFPLPLS